MRSLTCTFLPGFPSRKFLQSLLLRLIIKAMCPQGKHKPLACSLCEIRTKSPRQSFPSAALGSEQEDLYMGEFKDQKELKMAMSGRMGLMAGGVLLIFTALSSTLMYGINFFSLASKASGGDAECLEILESANVSISMIQIAAVCFVIAAIAELAVGALCAALSNRLDKAVFTVRAAALLLGVEILMQVFLFLTGLMNLSLLITSIVIPAYLLWSATRLRKLAKIYPDRKTAVNTKKAREQQKKPATPVQKKSLHERAMMNEAVHRWDEVLERNTGAAGEETEEKTDSEPENESVSEGDAASDEADCE